MKKNAFHIVLTLLLLTFPGRMLCTHLVGGFISYEYISTSSFGNRYNVTITAYRDCKQGSIKFTPDIDVCVFYKNNLKLYKSFNFLRKSLQRVQPVGRTDCPEATQVCLEKAIFSALVDLPVSSFGYYVKWEVCCRNIQVNLRNDQNNNPWIGQTYQTIIPASSVHNSSPYFTEVPVPFICINDTTELNNYAIDPNGDSLVYKLATPWYGASLANSSPVCPPQWSAPVSIFPSDYVTNYSGTKPFGPSGIAVINSSNGITTFMAKQTGNYAVAIDLEEYDRTTKTLLSSTRLDMQILVIDCAPNNKPTISSSAKSYTIMAGEKLCFNVTSNDKDNDNITLTGIGDILTGANGFTGNRATFPNAFAKGSVSSQFCWQTDCNQARNTPYIFTAQAVDDGCPSKFTIINVNIKVNPFTGKDSLIGPKTACEGAKGEVYLINTKANTPAELVGITHDVKVTNGVLVSQNLNQIMVNWNKGSSTGIIDITPISRYGCRGTPFQLKVNLLPPAPTPVLPSVDTVCENTAKIYSTAFNGSLKYQWWVNNGSVLGSMTSNSINITWGAPGKAYAKLVQYTLSNCPGDTATINVWISKPKTPGILGKKTVCPNNDNILYSVNSQDFGSVFQWFVSGGNITGSTSGNSILVNWGNPGIGYIKVIEINRFGCPGDTVAIPILKTYNLIADSVSGDTDICEFTLNQVFSVPNTAHTTYNWNVTGGTITSGQGSNSILVDWGANGSGSVSMYETSFDSVNNKTCISNLITRNVNIHPYPTANSINGVAEVCQSGANGTYKVNGFINSVYLWSINNDTSNINGQGSNTISISYSKSGTFNVRVIETSEFGCKGSPIDLVLIVHPKPQTTAIIGDSIICSPNLLNYPYSTSGFPTSTFYWFINGGNPVTASNSNSINVNWNGQQLNKIRVVEVSDFGCVGDTIDLDVFYDNPFLYLNYITVNPPPREDDGMDVLWKINNAPRYNNQFFIERRKAGSGGAFLNVGTVSGTTVMFNNFNTFNDSNAWEYRVKGFDLCGNPIYTSIHTNILLKGSKTDAYAVRMNFTPYIGWGNAIVKYDLYRMLKNTTQYELYESNITSFNAAYSNGLEYYTQCYRVMATKVGTDTVTWSNDICFNFEPVIFIPDAFSPNSDDYNDVFMIKGGALKTVQYFIYNRWGEKLFVGDDINTTWDGTYKGVDQPQDVYMFYCYYSGFDGRKYSTKGTITLLR